MQFLSIAAREVRVAARRPATFRLRLFSSSAALAVSAFALWFVTLFGGRPASGDQLFFTLTWVSFICACIVGPALTSDCINEERNNGTLGLLFLTNLNSLSISLGKLIGQGILAVYSVVAIIPVMALAVLFGGADAESLAKAALVLFVTLTLSLVAGMFGSTVCRKPWVAAALALLILAVFVLGIPLLSALLSLNRTPEWIPSLQLLSPSYSLSMASSTARLLSGNRFWAALGVQMLIALSLFGLLTSLLPRLWRDRDAGLKKHSLRRAWARIKYGSLEQRREVRARLLNINPILWLSSRARFGSLGNALLFLALAFAVSRIGNQARQATGPNGFYSQMAVWIVGIAILYLLFCLRVAAAASERFAADRKAGALELVLCTPLQTRQIIRGHFLGLLRKLWAAALLLLCLHAFGLNYIIEAIRIDANLPRFGLREVFVRPLRHLFITPSIPNEIAPLYIAGLAVLTAAILIIILWIALAWLGTALSLKLKRELLAPWLSLLLLAIPPLPIFIGLLPFVADQQQFASNLYLGMLRVGATGFFVVLLNALIWLRLARRWTHRKLRAIPSASSRQA